MASTSSNMATLEYYRLTYAQLTALETAVKNLDQQLLYGMEEKVAGRWTASTKKAIDFRVQGLLGEIVGLLHIQPCPKEIHIRRTQKLTRRIRQVMRVFKNKPEYRTSITPDISWDGDFAPPELYLKEEKEKEIELVEVVKVPVDVIVDKGKRKADDEGGGHAEPVKKCQRNEVEQKAGGKGGEARWVESSRGKSVDVGEEAPSSKSTQSQKKPSQYIDLVSDKETVLPTPKTKSHKKRLVNLANLPPPPQCKRCMLRNHHCVSHGYGKACQTCRDARQACTHSKLAPEDAMPDTHHPPPSDLPIASSATCSVQKKRKQEAGTPEPSKVRKIMFELKSAPSKELCHRGDQVGPSNRETATVIQATATKVNGGTKAPSVEGEELHASLGPTDITAILNRIEELESEVGKLLAVKQKANMPANYAQIKETSLNFKRLEKTMEDATHQFNCKMAAFQPLLEARATKLGEKVEVQLRELGKLIDNETTQRHQENQEKQRWWDEDQGRVEHWLEKVEKTIEERMQELGTKWEKRMDDRTAHLSIDIEKTPWVRAFQRREQLRAEEIQRAFQQRPTLDQVQGSYTSRAVTENIIEYLAQIQLSNHKQHQPMQARLSTMEKLFLQLLAREGSTAHVGAHGQLNGIFQRSEAAIRGEVQASSSATEGITETLQHCGIVDEQVGSDPIFHGDKRLSYSTAEEFVGGSGAPREGHGEYFNDGTERLTL